jgi:hypothetical protein
MVAQHDVVFAKRVTKGIAAFDTARVPCRVFHVENYNMPHDENSQALMRGKYD